MYSTGIFKLAEYNIEFNKWNEPIYLIPFGDVHRFAPLCHTEKWKEFLEWAKKKDNCYFIGMGDYDDMNSCSERNILKLGLHEATIASIEDLYYSNCVKLAKELSFMNGKLIGLLEGNHYGQFSNGTTTTQKLCELLKCNYLGVNTYIRLRFKYKGWKQHTSLTLNIWAHHGRGASRTIGGSLNRVEQMVEMADADIYLMAHDHKKSIGLVSRLELKANTLALKQKKILLARTGSFLKGYEPDVASYVVDSGMKPTDLGVVKIEMTPKRTYKNCEEKYIDIHASI